MQKATERLLRTRCPHYMLLGSVLLSTSFRPVLQTENPITYRVLGYIIQFYKIHRRVQAGMELWRSSCPTCPADGGPPRCPEPYPEKLQGWRLHNVSGQPVLVLGHPHSGKCLHSKRTYHISVFILYLVLSKKNSVYPVWDHFNEMKLMFKRFASTPKPHPSTADSFTGSSTTYMFCHTYSQLAVPDLK